MDTMMILYIVIAAVIGAAIAYLFAKKNVQGEEKVLDSANKEKDLAEDYERKLQESTDKANELKDKYERLLAEANDEIAKLDAQLAEAINGNIDEAVKKQLVDVDKLKKDIKNLEEEIEDYEDDIKDIKKKLKNKESENLELQDNLFKEQRACKQLHQDLERIKEELEEKEKDCKLKKGSLEFIQEILTAKQASDASTKELHSNVDKVVNFISGELKDCIKASYKLENEDAVFGSGLQRWAIAAKKNWIQGKTTIAFVGEFSAGKTSIVNRILSQDDPSVPLLPVSAKATTAIPTYISGGPSTLYHFVSPDNLEKVISEETFKKISKEVLDQVKGVSSLIQYFVMKYKNPNLEKISILDTPGFNSNDKEDAERTIGVINECDALFWVFDVNAGEINRSSISLIKKNLKKPLYVVINKVDTKAKTEIDSVEQKIGETLQNEGISVQKFIRFSSKAALDDIMQPILSVTHDSEHDNYIEHVREQLNSLERKQNQLRKQKNDEYTKLERINIKLDSDFDDVLKELEDNCQSVCDLPQKNEHKWNPFKDENYEMETYEYEIMKNLLDDISNKSYPLKSISERKADNQSKIQKAYDEYLNVKNNWQRLLDCKRQFETNVKPFLKK